MSSSRSDLDLTISSNTTLDSQPTTPDNNNTTNQTTKTSLTTEKTDENTTTIKPVEEVKKPTAHSLWKTLHLWPTKKIEPKETEKQTIEIVTEKQIVDEKTTTTVTKEQAKADAAKKKATDAQAKADAAKQKADEETIKAETAKKEATDAQAKADEIIAKNQAKTNEEKAIQEQEKANEKTIKDAKEAQAKAAAAQKKLGETVKAASQAQTKAETAKKEATDAQAKAEKAKQKAAQQTRDKQTKATEQQTIVKTVTTNTKPKPTKKGKSKKTGVIETTPPTTNATTLTLVQNNEAMVEKQQASTEPDPKLINAITQATTRAMAPLLEAESLKSQQAFQTESRKLGEMLKVMQDTINKTERELKAIETQKQPENTVPTILTIKPKQAPKNTVETPLNLNDEIQKLKRIDMYNFTPNDEDHFLEGSELSKINRQKNHFVSRLQILANALEEDNNSDDNSENRKTFIREMNRQTLQLLTIINQNLASSKTTHSLSAESATAITQAIQGYGTYIQDTAQPMALSSTKKIAIYALAVCAAACTFVVSFLWHLVRNPLIGSGLLNVPGDAIADARAVFNDIAYDPLRIHQANAVFNSANNFFTALPKTSTPVTEEATNKLAPSSPRK